MTISKKEVEHIAHLARIRLEEAEKEQFSQELSGILDFIEKLNEIQTEAITPMSGGTALESITRSDDSEEHALAPTHLLAAAPETREGYVAVKAVFQ